MNAELERISEEATIAQRKYGYDIYLDGMGKI